MRDKKSTEIFLRAFHFTNSSITHFSYVIAGTFSHFSDIYINLTAFTQIRFGKSRLDNDETKEKSATFSGGFFISLTEISYSTVMNC